MYTDHQGTDDQCALISVASAVPPVSVHQCIVSVLISASCQCPSVTHISVFQCTSMPHISGHLSCLSVSPISASQCHLSMPISATYQCQSVPPNSVSAACQCHLSVLPFSAHQ
ncbi:unnamed protein product [Staurois parvus]|uniref:Uncharacterized protein n=1 Tax=Staurois parvus TaxID=386267 RepID=A0ABN9HEV2_9NEOB|nr:unnamed protein product [Staurois parvus]